MNHHKRVKSEGKFFPWRAALRVVALLDKFNLVDILCIILHGLVPSGSLLLFAVAKVLIGLKVVAWWIYGSVKAGALMGDLEVRPSQTREDQVSDPSCKCSDLSILPLHGLTFHSLIFDQIIKQTPA